jgi:hypothetical protein
MACPARHVEASFDPTRYFPTMNSLVVYSVEVGPLAAYYEAVLGVTPTPDPWGGIQLQGDAGQILVHPIPPEIAKTIEIRTPPEPREESAIKPVFDVASIELALVAVTANGGVDLRRTFSIEGLTFHDVLDPEGNVIQLRERNS